MKNPKLKNRTNKITMHGNKVTYYLIYAVDCYHNNDVCLPSHAAVTSGDQDWVVRSLPVATQVYSFVPDSAPFLHPVNVTLLPKL